MTNDREERIRERAHEIWEQEGRPQGRHDDHWERATREVDGGGSEAAQMASMKGVSADPSESAKGRKRRVGSAAEGEVPAKGRRSRSAGGEAATSEGAQAGTASRGRRSGPREVTSEGTKPDAAPPSSRRRSTKVAGAEGADASADAAQASTGRSRRRKTESTEASSEGATGEEMPKRGRRSAKSAATKQ